MTAWRKTRLRPTALGVKALVFFATLVGAFYAAPYTNLFFLLLVFGGVLGGLGTLWALRNVAGLDGTVAMPPPAPAGAQIPIAVRLFAGGARHRRLLRCRLQIGSDVSVIARVDVVAGQRTVEGELAPLPRGVHDVAAAWVESTYPFGLTRVRRALQPPTQLVVHPAPTDLGDAHSRAEVLGQLGVLAVAGADEQPSGVREFRSGDEPRRVHWKATARRGRLAVLEWDADGRSALETVLDRRVDEGTLERALSWLTALALWAKAHDEILVVHSQDHHGSYGSQQRSWDELLTWLASVQPLPPDAPPPPSTSPMALRVVAIVTAGGAR